MRIKLLLAVFPALLAAGGVGAGEAFFQGIGFGDDVLGAVQALRPVVCLPAAADAPAPRMDGVLDDQVWKGAVRLDKFNDLHTGREPARAVHALMARIPAGLCIAFDAEALVPPDLARERHSHGSPGSSFRCLFNSDPNRFGRVEVISGIQGEQCLAGAVSTNTTHLKDYLWPAWKPAPAALSACKYDLKAGRVRAEFFIPYSVLVAEPPGPDTLWSFALYDSFSKLTKIPNSDQYQQDAAGSVFGGFWGDSHAQVDRWPRLYFGTQEAYSKRFVPPVARLYMDREAYSSRDEAGEAYLEVFASSSPLKDFVVDLLLKDASGKVMTQHGPVVPESGAMEIMVGPGSLPPGKYTLAAAVRKGADIVAQAERAFVREPDSRLPAIPSAFAKEGVPISLFSDPRLGDAILPVSIGVPMPRGLIRDASKLLLERDFGNQAHEPDWRAVPAQFDPRDRWYRGGSIRWLGVSFDAEYRQGFPARYRLKFNLATNPPALKQALALEEKDGRVTVTTGPARFVIATNSFRLVDAAWLDIDGDGKFSDMEQIVRASEGDGLRYENQDKSVFTAAHARNRVRLLEVGPMRAVVAVDGWYENEKGIKECRHTTRLFFAAGSPTVKIKHTWINTVDTRAANHRVRDISFSLGVPGASLYAFGGACGGFAEGQIPETGIYQIQLRSDTAPIETEIGKRAGDDMGRMAGWLFAGGKAGGVSLAGRDFWKIYPKELRVTREGAAVHLWPVHGREVFSRDDELRMQNIPKLLSAHQGRELAWNLPNYSYEKMGEYWQEDWAKNRKGFGPFTFWKAVRGFNANAQGVASSVEVDLSLHPPKEGSAEAARRGVIIDVNPHGVADPEWLKFTYALGPLHPFDPVRFGSVERLHKEVFERVYMRQVDWLDDYGMWNWPDAHNYAYNKWDPSARTLHRFWRNSEYQPNRMGFIRYLRSGDPVYWRWASEKFRHGIDVDAVNYGDDRPVAPYHQRGSTYHCKGTLHWGGNGGVSAHFVTYDWMLLDYFLTGDPRGPDFVAMWAPEVVRDHWVGEPERETCVPGSELAFAYQHFRDARFLKPITHIRDAAVTPPIENFLAVPWMSQMFWFRMHEYCGDPRIKERMVEHWGDGSVKKRNDLGNGLEQYLFYKFTGDRRALMLFSNVNGAFFNPRYTVEHPVAYELGSWPFLQAALAEIGASGDVMVNTSGAWQIFWQKELERAKSEKKAIWGREYK